MTEENQQPVPPAAEATPSLSRMNNNIAAKTSWPELVGLTAEEGERKIKEEKPGTRIQVVPPDCFVTMDFRQNRVRIYVDSMGKIARPPKIG